jgi:integrase
MATVDNRSNLVVSVPKHPELTRSFAYDNVEATRAYYQSLITQGHKPSIAQLEDSIQVRVRRVGHQDLTETFKSFAEADSFIKRVESEQAQGLFVDYTTAANVTFAQIIERYIKEECPSQKGGANYTIMLRAILADSTHELKKRTNLRKREMQEFGEMRTPLGANREPMGALEWVQLPLTQIRATDFNDFVADRLQYVAAPTVDRQLDLLSSVMNKALVAWGYHLERNPMLGVKRPKYFNERDRRLSDQEEALLLAAARQEDQLRSLELRVEELAGAELQRAKSLSTHYSRNDVRKTALEAARRKAVEEGFPHIPLYEAFMKFQLATAARRGEALGLFWDRVNFKNQTALLPTSKNGKPRTLYVRTDILELMQQLPRGSDLVFDVTVKVLYDAWKRMCAAAGIEDLHIHDMRHEGISRAADSGLFPTVLDLQAYSGHRDLRSLSRYFHPSASVMKQRLEAAEQKRLEQLSSEDRERLQSSAMLIANAPPPGSTNPPSESGNTATPPTTTDNHDSIAASSHVVKDDAKALPPNVTRLRLPAHRWATSGAAAQALNR